MRMTECGVAGEHVRAPSLHAHSVVLYLRQFQAEIP
jgi:hypothetical protein